VGNSYANVTLRGPDREAVVAFLREERRRAYVTPTWGGITVVFDQAADADGAPDELPALAEALSRRFDCPALAAAVHDDDVLLLWLHDRGALAGEYDSRGARRLRARTLKTLFGTTRSSVAWLWTLLALPRPVPVLFETWRHAFIVRALGLPDWALATGYRYVREGEPPEGLDPAELRHTGD
jgi:hypothetical protein